MLPGRSATITNTILVRFQPLTTKSNITHIERFSLNDPTHVSALVGGDTYETSSVVTSVMPVTR